MKLYTMLDHSLLRTATNEIPHERFFIHKRRSTFGTSLPTWKSQIGSVFLKRHVRASKTKSLVEQVDQIHAMPNCMLVRFPNGRELIVSICDIAPTHPMTPASMDESSTDSNPHKTSTDENDTFQKSLLETNPQEGYTSDHPSAPPTQASNHKSPQPTGDGVRRSTTIRKHPDHLCIIKRCTCFL